MGLEGGLLGEGGLPGGGSPWRGVSLEGESPWRGVLPGGGSPWRGVSLEGVSLEGVSQHALRQTPPVNRMTDACENITLPQTSFEAVKNVTLEFF